MTSAEKLAELREELAQRSSGITSKDAALLLDIAEAALKFQALVFAGTEEKWRAGIALDVALAALEKST